MNTAAHALARGIAEDLEPAWLLDGPPLVRHSLDKIGGPELHRMLDVSLVAAVFLASPGASSVTGVCLSGGGGCLVKG